LFPTNATPQLSPVTGLPNTTPVAVLPALADTVTFAGQLIVGGVLSSTITRCVHVAVFPLPSVTVQVTKFVPSGKTAGALLVTDATLQLSPVTALPKVTLTAVQPALTDTVTSAGQVIVGGVVSRTITRCVHVALFPLPSVTVQVTTFVPSG